jgi:hypothetical protein
VTDTRETPRWLEYRRVEDLPEHPRNPSDHDLPELRASILRFGFTTPPMLCERTGLLAEGHGRKKVTLMLKTEGRPADLPEGAEWPPPGVRVSDGDWLVPVVRGWSSADDAELEAYLLAGNYRGGWHNDMLAALLADLAEVDGGLAGTGFREPDLDLLLSELAAADTAPTDPNAEWEGMPDYENADMRPKLRLLVSFQTEEDRGRFLELCGNPRLFGRGTSFWWPQGPDDGRPDGGYIGEDWSKQYVAVSDQPPS